MRIADVHETYREALCLTEALQRLGFDEAAIDWAVSPIENPNAALLKTHAGDVCLFVQLQTQGRSWLGCVGPVPESDSADAFQGAWRAAVDAFNQAGQIEGDYVWSRSKAAQRIEGIAARLRQKGFVIPKEMS